MNSHHVAITAFNSSIRNACGVLLCTGSAMLLALSASVSAPVSAATSAPAHGEAGHDCAAHHAEYTHNGQKESPTTPTAANYAFNPNVISAAATGDIRLSARLNGPAPTAVTLVAEWGVSYTLTDAGGANDAVAGDRVYSVQLPLQSILSRRVASDVGRVFVGYLDVFSGATRNARINVFAQVRTADIPTVTIKPLGASAQLSTHLLNISVPSLYRTHDLDTPSIESVAQAAYAHLTDQFDFLNVVFDRQQIENRYHFPTRTNVAGLGQTGLNINVRFGNPSKLIGISVFPSGSFFDGASTTHSHEIGHQWVSYLKNPELASGAPHWPTSTMAFGIMGLSIPGASAGGNFSCKLTPEASGLRVTAANPNAQPLFNPLDLYLMGLLPAAEVPDQWVTTDPSFGANWGSLCDGRLLTSGYQRLSIAEVIAANGARSPDFSAAQRSFRVATVVVSDGLLSLDAMSFYDHFAKRMEARTRLDMHDGLLKAPGAPFFVATGGRGALIATVDPAVAITNRVTAVEYLNAQLNYYFITSRDGDKAALDGLTGWARTGASFDMLANPDPLLSPNVRFYFDQVARAGSRGSHFFSIDPADVAALTALNPRNTLAPRLPYNEGVDSFAYRPVASACATGTRPVYRLFRGNARFPDDPNHRFTTSRTVYDQFVAAGWDGEGVNFCVPAN